MRNPPQPKKKGPADLLKKICVEWMVKRERAIGEN